MSETAPPSDKTPGIQIVTQYIKDASFENPHAPESLVGGWGAPEPGIQVALAQQQIQDDLYEVVLSLRVEAKNPKNGKMCFLLDMQYGALALLVNIAAENRLPALMVEVPKLLFPFLRESVAAMTVKGGYPPLYLAPVNFEAIFLSEVKRLRDSQGQAAGRA